jgi:hypothetical protein
MLQRAVLAIGTLSLLKPAPDQMRAKPSDELDRYLSKHGRTQLASDFTDYRLAINALKHGQGRSHAELLARASTLDFKSERRRFVRRRGVTSPKSIS